MKCSECKYWRGSRGDKHCVCVTSMKPCEVERKARRHKREHETPKHKNKMLPYDKRSRKVRCDEY